MLRRLTSTEIALESPDKRIIRVIATKATQFVTTDNTGKSVAIPSTDLDPGDHLTIGAVRDDRNYFVALSVRFDKKGTPSEKAAAREPLEETISTGAAADQPSDDPDRPRMKRSGAAPIPAAPVPAALAEAAEPAARPATTMAPAPTPRSDDDPGPPVLRRNRTLAQRSEGAANETAPAQPAATVADRRVTAPPVVEADPIVRRAAGDAANEDAVIAAAREAAAGFTETLPNYIVKQMTTRYQTEASAGQKTSWHALDVVTADLTLENGKESYKNILVNGKAPKQALEKTGSWSNGEFASMLQLVLHPGSEADFHGKRSATIANRSAWRYEYAVEQPNSHWTLEAAGQSYAPAYSGSLWIDKETSRVLRIEMAARRIPGDFPLDSAESTVDYEFIVLGERKFLLPTHSEVLSCQRGTRDCSRNVIDFRNYRKFGSDTSISFDKEPRQDHD